MSNAVVSIRDLTFRYAKPIILQQINWAIEPGEFIALVGPNGCGKSTLLKLILGLLKPQTGHLSVLGQTPQKARKHIGYVPQFAAFNPSFPITVKETVLQGRLGCGTTIGPYSRTDHHAADRALEEAEAAGLADYPVNDLSGGQLQRVMLARALASTPQFLILDEPTANIDTRGENDIFDLLQQINQRSMSILVVSHNIAFISSYVSRVACLNQSLECHHTDALTSDLIQDLYRHNTHAIHHQHH